MSKDKKQTDGRQRDSYETGYTQQPKSYGGLVAILLVMVILLGGATSYLSIMNVQLVLQNQQEPGVQIEFLPAATSLEEQDDQTDNILPGVEGRTVSAPEQAFYHWPAGVVVTRVQPDSAAARAGLAMGDILTQVNGKPIGSLTALYAAVAGIAPGTVVLVTYCRDGESYHDFECIWE